MKHRKGFTLIETLFAVLLFTTSLVALMAISGRGNASTATNREELTARMLALEGIESARNIRDRNFGSNQPWDTGLLSNPDCSGGCDVEYVSGVPTLTQNQGPLYRNLSSGQYGLNPNGAELTPYSRTVIVSLGSSPDEMRVESRVTWFSRGRQRTIMYQSYLMKWRTTGVSSPL
jgi:type II secretory pathway pseudopilin PulG